MFSVPLWPGENLGKLWPWEDSRAGKNPRLSASRFFTDLLLISPKRLPRFSSGYEGRQGEHVLVFK